MYGDLYEFNIFYTQLRAIYEAVRYVNVIISNLTIPASVTWTTIANNNLSALQSLAKPRYQSDQGRIRQITDGILSIAGTGMKTNLQWLSSSDDCQGLHQAVHLSQQAESPENPNLIPRWANICLKSSLWRTARTQLEEQGKEEFLHTSTRGKSSHGL